MADRKRCAIYTRKSTEEGLEQSFNSLDAQREACALYILSQAHEGWEPVRDIYDDGGWSGGNMERPALKQLLQDVAAGRIDVIVVYKVDRLTRSLADFARIVDVLDKSGASFVSVTQAFNTTNSMGRLTLNVLLSFAQFEREVTGERIRDKIAASKRKGIWMGGPVPLGYCLQERRLHIDPDEARTVRTIFERYVCLRSVRQVAEELAQQGVRSKRRTRRDGTQFGGTSLSRGAIAAILKNPIYLGKVHHRGELFDGEHHAIVDRSLWDEVQHVCVQNGRERKLGSKLKAPSLLTGMLVDPDGKPMSPTHATKGSQRYRYYSTRDASAVNTPWRLPAREIEAIAIRGLGELLVRQAERALASGELHLGELSAVRETATSLPRLALPQQRAHALAAGLCVRLSKTSVRACLADDEIEIPADLVRRGRELRIVLPADRDMRRHPDPVLLRLIAHATAAQKMVITGEPHAVVAGYGRRHLWQLLRISWLAPDILSAIAEGAQPMQLTGRKLLRATNIPLDWAAQRVYFGFA